MNTTSPYHLLRRAAGGMPSATPRFPMERWLGVRSGYAPAAANAPVMSSVPAAAAPSPALPEVSPNSPAARMRTPPPMYPPNYPGHTGNPLSAGRPIGIPSYNSSPQPTRRANYDAIINKHQDLAHKVVYTEAPLEPAEAVANASLT